MYWLAIGMLNIVQAWINEQTWTIFNAVEWADFMWGGGAWPCLMLPQQQAVGEGGGSNLVQSLQEQIE